MKQKLRELLCRWFDHKRDKVLQKDGGVRFTKCRRCGFIDPIVWRTKATVEYVDEIVEYDFPVIDKK